MCRSESQTIYHVSIIIYVLILSIINMQAGICGKNRRDCHGEKCAHTHLSFDTCVFCKCKSGYISWFADVQTRPIDLIVMRSFIKVEGGLMSVITKTDISSAMQSFLVHVWRRHSLFIASLHKTQSLPLVSMTEFFCGGIFIFQQPKQWAVARQIYKNSTMVYQETHLETKSWCFRQSTLLSH